MAQFTTSILDSELWQGSGKDICNKDGYYEEKINLYEYPAINPIVNL